MKGYIYIIRSDTDGSFYLGSTNCCERRLHQHNTGQVRSTSKRKPWQLVQKYELYNPKEARRIEQLIKKQKQKIHPDWVDLLIQKLLV